MRRAHVVPPGHPVYPEVVPPVRVDPTGRAGPMPKQARGPGWRRTGRGLYVPSSVARELPRQRIVEAAAGLHDVVGVTGWAGLHWLGARWSDGLASNATDLRPVTIAVGGNI